jgi:hypothetical protein
MSIITIAFLENKLTLRGTSVALYDYADYNEKILHNTSLIITRSYESVKGSIDVDIKAYNKFSSRFNIIYYNDTSELDSIIEKNNIDILFIEKSGESSDNLITTKCKTIVQCVFETHDPHGTYYCGLSEWLNTRNNTNIPVLHYMVHVDTTERNLRSILDIPEDAIVFGSYGGTDPLLHYTKEVIYTILNNPSYSNIYFLFMNIPGFCESSKNLRFIQGTDNMQEKRAFINTCDAMIYGRVHGETFGLACAEFSICNKPIIANSDPKDRFHIDTLGDKIILHNSSDQLFNILTNYSKYKLDVSENGYKKYTPEFVMKEFKQILDILM